MVTNLCSSIDFTFDSPSNVNLNEKFSVTISADSSEVHDVKIFVGKASKEYCEIYQDDSLRSPYYYLNSAFPSQKEFSLVAHKKGETKVCVRLRPIGKSSFDEVCNNIIVEENTDQESDISEEPEVNFDEKNIDEKDQEPVTFKEAPRSKENKISIHPPQPEKQPNEKIILSSQNTIINSRKYDLKKQVMVSFVLFLTILLILIALKKL